MGSFRDGYAIEFRGCREYKGRWFLEDVKLLRSWVFLGEFDFYFFLGIVWKLLKF